MHSSTKNRLKEEIESQLPPMFFIYIIDNDLPSFEKETQGLLVLLI